MQASSASPTFRDKSEGTTPSSGRPTWRVVLVLALPVLVQQMLILIVSRSDSWLAGHLKADDANPAAFQAAQTTVNYLAWFISSYIVLVSVGSTALVARFTGAGERALAIHTTNQSILLAAFFGLAGTVLGLTFRDSIVHVLQLRGDAHALDCTSRVANQARKGEVLECKAV